MNRFRYPITWVYVVSLILFFTACCVVLADHVQAAPEEFLTLWAGALPIVLSAPHGGREALPGIPIRRGLGVTQFLSSADTRTDELAEIIAARLAKIFAAKPHLVVARFERKYVDVNRPSSGAYESDGAKIHYEDYHQALAAACRRVRADWGRGLLLDIHGEGADAQAIFRGTNNGQTVMSLTNRFGIEALNGGYSVVGQLVQKGYKVLPANGAGEKEKRYVGGFIVQNYGSHQHGGIDAMQLEFGSALRSRPQLERTATDVADAVAAFARTYLPPLR